MPVITNSELPSELPRDASPIYMLDPTLCFLNSVANPKYKCSWTSPQGESGAKTEDKHGQNETWTTNQCWHIRLL